MKTAVLVAAATPPTLILTVVLFLAVAPTVIVDHALRAFVRVVRR